MSPNSSTLRGALVIFTVLQPSPKQKLKLPQLLPVISGKRRLNIVPKVIWSLYIYYTCICIRKLAAPLHGEKRKRKLTQSLVWMNKIGVKCWEMNSNPRSLSDYKSIFVSFGHLWWDLVRNCNLRFFLSISDHSKGLLLLWCTHFFMLNLSWGFVLEWYVCL